jgi:PAS domain S-box-containing protein
MVETPRTATEHVNLEATLELILKNAINALSGGAGLVATWSEAEHRFVVGASYGLDNKTLSQLQPILSEIVPDLAGSKESFNLLSELLPGSVLPLSEKGMRQDSIIALPLQIGGEWMGLIYVLRPIDVASFSKVDQPILAAFAEQAAIAVQNAKLAYLLAEEKWRVESILENTADGIMDIDSNRRIINFNRAMEKLTGYDREEVVGKECFRVLALRDWQNNNLCHKQCPMLASSEGSSSIFDQEGKIQTKDGHGIDVAMAYSIIRSPEGKPINAVVNMRDISRLREVEQLREVLLSMLGHELQTPLSIIKGYSSTLAREEGKWDKGILSQGLKVIEEESDRLSQVMNKLLLASRVSVGALALEKEPVQLSSLASKVVRRLQPLTDIHTFKVDFEHDFPSVVAEPDLMEQVLSNLVDNAVKYSPHGGIITVSGRREGKKVRVTVADEGIGIPMAKQEDIFKRFHKVDSSATQKSQGVGLGLYICKSIIEAHGGSIGFTSKFRKGSQFSFTLPLEEST